MVCELHLKLSWRLELLSCLKKTVLRRIIVSMSFMMIDREEENEGCTPALKVSWLCGFSVQALQIFREVCALYANWFHSLSNGRNICS